MYVNKIPLTVIAVLAVLCSLEILDSHSTVSYALTMRADLQTQKNDDSFVRRKLSEMTLRKNR
jgi:hypothetical protein